MVSTQRRVVITGMGLISPLGNSKEALWDALSQGRSGVGPLTTLSGRARCRLRFAAEAKQFSRRYRRFRPPGKRAEEGHPQGAKVMCRECQMGVAAAQLALADAGLRPGKFDPERTGITFGTDYMLCRAGGVHRGHRRSASTSEGEFDFSRWGGEGMTKMSPLWLLKYLPNMPASHLAIYNDLRGPNNSLTMREAAANVALGEASRSSSAAAPTPCWSAPPARGCTR